MASTNNSSAKIISIEAHPDNYRALCRNIVCNGFTNVLALNKAIWDGKCTITLRQRVSQSGLLTDDARVLLDHPTEMDSGLAVKPILWTT